MNYFFALFIFVFGSIIGSFLNVVVLRHNTGKTIGGRSQCFSCGKQLHWYELFPVFSFAFLMGKCSKCKSKISWQYPLVEVITGTVFLLTIANATGPIETFVGLTPEAFASLFIRLISFCFLIAISVYDMKHKIIPDEWVYSFVGLSFVSLFFGPINGAV
jgi:leader peptidase (prepilin peptidase)/N-methyltransferase